MSCILAATASGSGKTLLSQIILAWFISKGRSIQPFKVGPDYLDSQHMTTVGDRQCINLDLILTGEKWVKKNFYKYSSSADFSIIEGVMGLYDGLGATDEGSTAHIARCLNLPIVLIIDGRGKAASVAAIIKGFSELDKRLKIAGVVLNHVNTERHKALLSIVVKQSNVKLLGVLPTNQTLSLPSRHLGLIPPHEINNIKDKIEQWSAIASKNLDMKSFERLLLSANVSKELNINYNEKEKTHIKRQTTPIAIAQDDAFHFQYPELKEYLEELGMPLIPWRPTNNELIPKEAKGLIIPGGFPENFAEQISQSRQSLDSIKEFYGKHPIYAECGGMLLLGKAIQDSKGVYHSMTGLLPFTAKKNGLKIGYRKMESRKNSLILEKGDKLIGHEFHYWEIKKEIGKSKIEINKINHSWEVKGWGIDSFKEGWSNNNLHASWIHLHWPTTPKVLDLWRKSILKNM